MIDAEIATLAREAKTDRIAHHRWRVALLRAGRGDEAGLEVGDLVEIMELQDRTHYLKRPWTARLVAKRTHSLGGGWYVTTKNPLICGGNKNYWVTSWAGDRITLLEPVAL